jgi:hypothetical protein
MTDTFDFSSFEDVPTGELRVRDPETGAPTPMTITLAGPEHPDRKRRTFARQRRMRAALAKTGKIPVTDPEEDDAQEVEELVSYTLGWAGTSAEYSPEAARKLYSDPKRRWLRDQVREALEERALFTRRSAAG